MLPLMTWRQCKQCRCPALLQTGIADSLRERGSPYFLPGAQRPRNTAVPSITEEMLWVAVFALVCMAAVGVALLGIAAYGLYAVARRLVESLVVLFRLDVREPEHVAEAPEPVPDT